MRKRRTFIIAEAGVNHNGSLALAKRLVDAAARAGADAVKFQTFKAAKLVTVNAARAAYQVRNTKTKSQSQYEMLKKLELADSDFVALKKHCRARKIEFLSTPFDEESLDFLVGLGIRVLKLGSGEVTNAPLLLKAARSRKPLILSTGMSTMADVEHALGVLAFGYTGGKNPSARAFSAAFRSARGKAALKKNLTLLHCTSEYPAAVEGVDLLSMKALADRFGVKVGYSDHTQGIHIPIAAAAIGATVLEKHFTLDRKMKGPDHKASLEPCELAEMVHVVRDVESAIGTGAKKPTKAELKVAGVARKSLVASRAIRAGERFTVKNVAVKRPGTGKSPMQYWDLIGKISKRAYRADEVL